MTRREYATPIIRQIIRENEDAEEKDIRKALRDAYPWGPRENHPYKVWSDEVRKQLFFWRRRHGSLGPDPKPPNPVPAPDPQQGKLF